MASIRIRHFLSFVQKRLLKTSATHSPASLLPPSPSSNGSTFAVQFLVNSCGIHPESAPSVAKKIRFTSLNEKSQENYQSVIDYFKSLGFNGSQIAKLIEKFPSVVKCNLEGNLMPKFDFLRESGFAGELLYELLIINPLILKRGMDSHIKPTVDFFKLYLENEQIVAVFRRSSWLLSFDVKRAMQPNIDVLIQEGVPASNISKFIRLEPRIIVQRHGRLGYSVNFVKNLGLEPSCPMFMHAVRVRLSMSDSTWNKKMKVLQSLGFSEEDVLMTLKKNPQSLACSEEKLRKGMDFYVHTMKLDKQRVISYPKFLMYDIEKRMLPRYNVLKILQSKNLIEKGKKIEWLLMVSDSAFLKDYVMKYKKKVPGLLDMYMEARNRKAKIDTL